MSSDYANGGNVPIPFHISDETIAEIRAVSEANAREDAKERKQLDLVASDLELVMPRNWLTPDLRMQVALWIVDVASTEPWKLTEI